MYADDTTLFDIGQSQNVIESNLQNSLVTLTEWCNCNGMIINTSKTKVMLITTYQKRTILNSTSLNLTFNNDPLNMIAKDKILGVFVDDNLTWTNHLDHICKKIASNLWLLSQIKENLSTEHRIQFYKTFIQPHIDYCSIIWSGTSQTNSQ